MSSDEFLCARCARHMKTCCQTAEVYVTRGDVGRIEQFTGERDFHEFRPVENSVYLPDDQDDDPVWNENVFQPDGTRRVLKRQEGGDCAFLGSAGCTLPLEVRPLICRIYPFDYNADGLLGDLAKGCPIELLRPGQDLVEALEMQRADAERWHEQLYAELRQEKQDKAAAPRPHKRVGPQVGSACRAEP
jgi:Fe-S-cluster containining protein